MQKLAGALDVTSSSLKKAVRKAAEVSQGHFESVREELRQASVSIETSTGHASHMAQQSADQVAVTVREASPEGAPPADGRD